jgi:hypothetical protein
LKSFIYVLSAFAVMGLAFWAYHENYKTQKAITEVEDLQRQIGRLMETRSVLRAEWAYLNRPDRLRELADLNFDRLSLMPLRPGQFGHIDQIAYPPEPEPMLDPELAIDNPVSVIGALPTAETDTETTEQQP